MKRKMRNRMISLVLSAVMLLGVTVTNQNTVTAAGTYDCTLTVTTPVPGEAPKQPVISDSSLEYELLGYMWEDECYGCGSYGTYLSDTEFMNWYSDVVSLSGGSLGNNALKSFENGHRYRVSAVAKVSNLSVASGTEGEVVCVNTASAEEIGTATCYLTAVSDLVKEMPEGVSLPSCLTEKDTLVMFGGVPTMVCAPEGHTHVDCGYDFDDEHHWHVCLECGTKLYYSISSHYVSSSETEPWTVTKKPTATETGLWEKKCSYCAYVYESVVVPCLNDQTVVNSYEALRAALAKGGKQWITIEKEFDFSDWLIQEDMTSGNTLKVDDPNADITIDMNGCAISRQTGSYDEALFEIKAGKLRILSKKYSSSNNSWNLDFKSFSSKCTLFRVYENGSLRVTNVSGTLANGDYVCANPSIISEGNLQIDGGVYENYVPDFDPTDDCPAVGVLINGGNAVINGGKYDAQSCAVAVKGGNVTINGGNFGAWDEAVYIMGNDTIVNIYGGKFDKTDTTNGWYQDYGVYCNGGVLNVYGGDFYGDTSGLCGGYYAKNINIYDGFFKLRGTGSGDCDGAFSFDSSKCKPIIYNGIFSGNKGIVAFYDIVDSSHSFILANYLVNKGEGYTISDDGGPVDINTKADYFGQSYLRIEYNLPYIISQPESVDALTGDDVVFRVKANNATKYVWYIFDADDESEQPYSWDSVKKYYQVSGEDTDTLVIKNAKTWFDNKGVCCTVYNDNGWCYSNNAYLTVNVKGDVNGDGVFNISDVVMMQKWIIKAGTLTNQERGDINGDGKINVYDLCLMKNML
ncbi:dockerin type I domain-containing protein, partial [Ruminococcus sp.]|uniref:dockerin type I domain-containing protein n=1 Tax=Ruminococcus sp. TaxID=41978 RepID=UPI003F0CF2E4